MYEYVVPSKLAYQNRKTFHSNQRNQYETTCDWFHRVFESLNGCEFGECTDFMFIDKFLTGLHDNAFNKYESLVNLTIDTVLSFEFEQKVDCDGSGAASSLGGCTENDQEYPPIDPIEVDVSKCCLQFFFGIIN